MKKIGEFSAKVYKTTESKPLKNGNKEYSYGTITIRDRNLDKFVDEIVRVKVFTETKKRVDSFGNK